MNETTPTGTTVAAVDLGSNSFHMLLARVDQGQPAVIDRMREMVQLASGLDKDRWLDAATIDRGIACLERFGQRLRHIPGNAVRAVGTNTLRQARNADEFLRRAEEALGHPIETIAGIEEARLIYLGVCQSLPNPSGRRLVIDIGGGSTELIVGDGIAPIMMESLYVGCVSMGRRFFRDGEITKKAWSKATLAAEQELVAAAGRFRKVGWDEAVGSSGTIRAAQATLRALNDSEEFLTPAGLAQLRDHLIKAGSVAKARLPGLSPRRRAVFPGGVVVLSAAAEALGLERIQRSDGALREGLLHDLLGSIRREDVRSLSVRNLADRYHVDLDQAQRVEATALELLAAVADTWNLDPAELGQPLGWAATLHEIGLDVAHSQYQRHGEYIIAAADLPGFTLQGQRRLASLVRAHRRKFPLEVFETLPGKLRRSLIRLAVLLRIATVLHRARSPLPLPRMEITAAKRSLELAFPDGWLDEHPLSRADLEQEASYLRAARYRLSFR